MENKEREDLDQLVNSAGWRRFCEVVTRDWGTLESGGGAFFTRAVADSIKDTADTTVLNHLRQITASQREIHKVMMWPRLRLQQLTPAAPVASPSRRGTL